MNICHLYIFFCEMSVKGFGPFLNWILFSYHYVFVFVFFLAKVCDLQDLGSPTRAGTQALSSESTES